jgi:broad specificity phosphatase PhoE
MHKEHIMGKLIIYLLRHGESVANVTHTFASRKLDLPLTEFGLEQVKQIANPMKAIGFTKIFASPLIRAQQTAEIIGNACRTKPIIIESLREINVGELDGKCIEEQDRRAIYDNVISKWDKGQNDIGFEDGETLSMVKTRINNFLKNLDDSKQILVVGHGLFFMAFIWLFCDNHGMTFEKGRINRCHYTVVKNIDEGFHILEHDVAPENSKKGLY